MTGKALAACDGRASAGALAPPIFLVVVALLAGPVQLLWRSRRGANWNFFGPYETYGPNPAKATSWIDALLRSPHETLVYLDPWFAGAFLPALLFAVPAALLLAVWLAGPERSRHVGVEPRRDSVDGAGVDTDRPKS